MRKTRSDSKLKNLPEDQYQTLVDWLLAGTPYRVIKTRLAEEFNVSTSNAALVDFWNECCSAALLARRQRAVGLADEVAAEAAARPGEFDSATIDALKQKAFELAVNPNADPRDVKGLFTLVLKARSQEIDQEQLTLARDKFQFDAARAALSQLPALRQIAADKKMNDSDKLAAARRRLFGEVPE